MTKKIGGCFGDYRQQVGEVGNSITPPLPHHPTHSAGRPVALGRSGRRVGEGPPATPKAPAGQEGRERKYRKAAMEIVGQGWARRELGSIGFGDLVARLTKKLAVSTKTAMRIIADLTQAGVLLRTKQGRQTFYRLAEIVPPAAVPPQPQKAKQPPAAKKPPTAKQQAALKKWREHRTYSGSPINNGILLAQTGVWQLWARSQEEWRDWLAGEVEWLSVKLIMANSLSDKANYWLGMGWERWAQAKDLELLRANHPPIYDWLERQRQQFIGQHCQTNPQSANLQPLNVY